MSAQGLGGRRRGLNDVRPALHKASITRTLVALLHPAREMVNIGHNATPTISPATNPPWTDIAIDTCKRAWDRANASISGVDS
jgi:hypothetical protein